MISFACAYIHDLSNCDHLSRCPCIIIIFVAKFDLHVLVGLIYDFPLLLGHLNVINLKLRAPKGKTVPSVVAHPYPKTTSSPVSEWDSTPQPNSQPSNFVSSFVPESNLELVEEDFSQEGELLLPTLFCFSYILLLINLM